LPDRQSGTPLDLHPVDLSGIIAPFALDHANFSLGSRVVQGIIGRPRLPAQACEHANWTTAQLARLRPLGAGAATGSRSAAAGSFFLRPPATGNSSGAWRRSGAALARAGLLANAGFGSPPASASCAKLRLSASIRLMTLGGSATSRGARSSPLVLASTSSRNAS